jgi:hypothetical protein
MNRKHEDMGPGQQEQYDDEPFAQSTLPLPLLTPIEIYEHTREEEAFEDTHQWDSLYIHGLVRVDEKISRSMRKDPPCESCKKYNRVCIVLADEDPYKRFLFEEKNVCCGWCEYATSSGLGRVPRVLELSEEIDIFCDYRSRKFWLLYR